MNEQEWWACDNPRRMLSFLKRNGPVSHRKLRLFACACCRAFDGVLLDSEVDEDGERFIDAVTTAERFADGEVDANELSAWVENTKEAWEERQYELHDFSTHLRPEKATNQLESKAEASAIASVVRLLQPHEWSLQDTLEVMSLAQETEIAWDLSACAAEQLGELEAERISASEFWRILKRHRGGGVKKRVREEQAGLLRDIFGPLPFRPLNMNSAWLEWNDDTEVMSPALLLLGRTDTDGSVVRRAKDIYRQFACSNDPVYAETFSRRWPPLTDTLQRAGCSGEVYEEICQHCLLQYTNSHFYHVKGCWVIDLLMRQT